MFCLLPDGVPSSQTNPLRNRAVLLLRSGKLLLGSERFMALQHIKYTIIVSNLPPASTKLDHVCIERYLKSAF
jgi:hypothetical protein